MTTEEALKNLKKCIAPFEVRDIVEQQQAEIERLEKICKADNNLITSLNKCYETAKTEAIKKFISCATDLCYKEFENDLEVAHTFASILTEAQKERLGEE